jgi:transcription antitermination factor NusG
VSADHPEPVRVRIVAGPFQGFEGPVEMADPERKAVTVRITYFGGREIPVTVPAVAVEPVD